MTPDLQRYYEDRIEMCSSQAWKDLMEDVQKMLEATDRITAAKDEKDFLFKRGEVSMMNWMLAIGSVSEETYEELKRDAQNNP